MSVFERYLTLWVALCIVVGIALGWLMPGVFQTIGAAEIAKVNIPVALLVWLMIIPMLVRIDFAALSGVKEHWRGIGVTLFINWAVKPFSMALLGWFYDVGNGVAQDYEQARNWYEMAANAGSAYAMGNLSRLYDFGLGTKADAKEAARWAAASVEGGDPAKLQEMKTSPDNFTPAFRKEIQALLKERGYYSGPLDGQFGAATQDAMDRLAKRT